VTEFGLLLPFDVDDPEFSRGVEVGVIWASLQHTDERTFTAHATNAEMLLRSGEALDLPARSVELDDGWLLVTFGGE